MENLFNAWPEHDLYYGRSQLMTDVKEINSENIAKVVSKAYWEHQHNVVEERWLIEYERGKQPILERKKKIRKEINAKIVVNKASEIVDTHVGYCFSNPITLVQRAKVEEGKSESDGEKDDKKIAMLNKMFTEQSKSTKDIELARNLFICGVGYEMILPTRKKNRERFYSPFELMVPNPMTTFVVYSNDAYREPVLGCTYSLHEDGTITLTAYTNKLVFELDQNLQNSEFETIRTTPNVLGLIPIVEFALNDRMAVFEKAIPILNAISLIDSDRVNDIMQHVQSLLWMHNCLLDDKQKKELVDGNGIVSTKSNGDGKEAKIEYLSQTLNETEVQKLVDHLLESLQQITATPSWQEASGGSTTGAMQLSNGWQCLEISAKTVEQLFIGPELQIIEAAIKIISADARPYSELKDIQLSDIEVRFCRTKTYDLVSKTNALVSLINAGVDGLTAFNTVGLFNDSQQAWCDSAKIINGIQKKMIEKEEPKTQTSNVIVDANASKDENGNGGSQNKEKDKTDESLQPSQVAGAEQG